MAQFFMESIWKTRLKKVKSQRSKLSENKVRELIEIQAKLKIIICNLAFKS